MSNNQNQTIHQSRAFRLSKYTNKAGKVHYRITCKSFLMQDNGEIDQVRDLVDPLRNKSGRFGTHWKYRNLKDAQRHWTMIMLRWAT